MENMVQKNVGDLIPHPRNREFFDDMTGDKWKKFKKSISENGVIEPIVITEDNVIVSGHQRVRACKELGITQIPCCQRSYDSEDQVLQALIETNIRQRGTVGGSAKKVGQRIAELQRIYGIRRGRPQNSEEKIPNNSGIKSQKDLAEMLGISVDTLQNYVALADMTPEVEELLDNGVITPTTARAIMKDLSPEEQSMFIKSLPDVKKLTGEKAKEMIVAFKSQCRTQDDYEYMLAHMRCLDDHTRDVKKEYLDALERMDRLKKWIGDDRSLKSAEQSAKFFSVEVEEFIRHHTGKDWIFDQIDDFEPSFKEAFIKAVKDLSRFTQQMLSNLEKSQERKVDHVGE